MILHERQLLCEKIDDLPWLTYLAIDKHPLKRQDFQRAHQRFTSYRSIFQHLEASYPDLVQGFHLRELPELRCRMLYIWDDACEALQEWDALADAWLLDGFKPTANEDMWSTNLYQLIAKRSHGKSTVATYSAAGHVRRGLISVGFEMKSGQDLAVSAMPYMGFSTKIRLKLNLHQSNTDRPQIGLPCAARRHRRATGGHIGAGIAGASVAHALRQHKISTTVFEAAHRVANGGSGNRLGLGHPLLHGGPSRQGTWYDAAFLHACQWPLKLAGRGAVLAAQDEAGGERWLKLSQTIPEDILRPLPPNKQQLPHGGCEMPSALLIKPAETVQSLLADQDIHYNAAIAAQRQDSAGIWLSCENGTEYGPFSDIIICSASNTLCAELNLTTARGQVIDVDGLPEGPAWSGRRYLLPGQPSLAGASYVLHDHGRELRPDEASEVIAALNAQAVNVGQWCGTGRASLRALSPDRLPYVGPLVDLAAATQALQGWASGAPAPRQPIPHRPGWWCSIGHGSRGLTGACYAATMLADAISGSAASTPLSHRQWVMPLRLLMRDLRKK